MSKSKKLYDEGPSTREKLQQGATQPKCTNCEHFRYERGIACRAFRQGIPQQIQSGEVSHLEPLPGDRGFQYEPMDD
jgi:hypothetical protein